MLHKLFHTRSGLLNLLCAILMIALLVCQFSPFWQYGEPDSQTAVSINGYIWFPTDNAALTKQLQSIDPDHEVDGILAMPLLHLLLCVAGIILCLFKPDTAAAPLFPLAAGLVGIWGYLAKPVFQAGMGWQLHLALCVLMALAGAAALAAAVAEMRRAE
ncbi:MAG: hypothetical protein IKJ26_07010 [Clostridia bacterium]|nr:hypothetical protein [Clostridia bacterium]